MHPNDLYEHFNGVLSILSNRGRYIFATPHSYLGPSDISSVFKCDRPLGMHLKEYTFQELKELLMQAGFKEIQAVFKIPAKISYFLSFMVKPKASQLYLAYLCFIENLEIIYKGVYFFNLHSVRLKYVVY